LVFLDERIKMDSITVDHFLVEKQKASLCAAQNKNFSGILCKHALIMFDAADPNLDKAQCIQIGTRLAEVQQDWVALLSSNCGGDREYKRAVTGIVKNFTNHLMDVVLEDKRVSYNELASIGLVHTNLSYHDERRLQETRSLFQHYVRSLCDLHGKQKRNMHAVALQVLQVASVLGASLDMNL